MTIWLKFRVLYQENMAIEEVAGRDPPSSCSPDTEVFRKNFEWEYLDTGHDYLAEISNFVSGEHGNRRGGTTRPPVVRFS